MLRALIVTKATTPRNPDSIAATPTILNASRTAGRTRQLPENSIPAFLRAIELGADAIELDVHATSDGVVIVHHDPKVTAPGAATSRLLDLSASELSRFPLAHDVEIPTLEAVLDAIGDRVRVYVEIKALDIELLVVRCIRESRASCAVHAFDHRIVKTVEAAVPRGSNRCAGSSASHRSRSIACCGWRAGFVAGGFVHR